MAWTILFPLIYTNLVLLIYMLTQPDDLVLNSRIYCGPSDPVVGGKGHAKKVVKYLLDDYYGVGHFIYMDNYFNFVGLFFFSFLLAYSGP